MNNKVSIIMPCHNGSSYIGQAIESVISQTYKDWELIIIDDNSSDTSKDVISKFMESDTRIKYLHTEKSTGIPATPRNVGIEAATGRYIAFLDCDDIWKPSKLERQLKLFDNEKCAVVFSYYEKINKDGNIISKIISSPKNVNYKQLLNGDCIGNLTGVYDTQKVGKVLQKEIHAEDYLMWLEILKKGFVAINTNTVEGQYRIIKTSTSANKFKSASWNWNIYKRELKLPVPVAMYHFCVYFVKGVIKYFQ